MNRITLDQANLIIKAALEKAAELGLKPLSIAVLDPGGHLIAAQRQDGCAHGRLHVASRKAAGALTVGSNSRKIAEMSQASPPYFVGLVAFAPGGAIAAAGGVIALRDGEPIGAVGVTGDSPDNDELVARAGLAAAGIEAQEA